MTLEVILDILAQWIAAIFSRLSEQLSFIMGEIMLSLSASLDTFGDFIQTTLGSIFTNLVGWLSTLTETLNNFVAGAKAMLETSLQQIVDLSIGVFDKVSDFVSGLVSSFQGLMGQTISVIDSFISSAISQVTLLVTGALSTIGGFANGVAAQVEGFISAILQTLQGTISAITVGLETAINKIVGTADSLVSSIGERLGDLRAAFAEAATDLGTKLVDDGSKILDPLKDKLTELFDSLALSAEPEEVAEMTARITSLTAGTASPAEMRNLIASEWTRLVPTHGWASKVMFTVLGLFGGLFLWMDLSRINSQIMLQDFAIEFPWQLLTPADTGNAWRRGFIERNEAVNTIRRQGYSASLSNIILDMTAIYPDEDRVLAQWHRGLLTEAQVDTALESLQRPPEYVEATKAASFPLPPIGDLITMAVREVFTPEIAERFGQFEDFPPEFDLEAQRQGLTTEWAKRYWGAHWALPSPRQGFEMLHRGVIDKEDLGLLLRALDVMPFWRDNLTAIAFNPFTRVDIRRMHKVGVLTDAEVLRAYKDIGYDEEKATKLQDFTLALSKTATADDEAVVKDLSRSAILGFFGDGLMDRTRAFDMLVTMGFSNDASNLFLDSVELDEQRKERKAEIQLALELVKAKIITIEGAESRLLSLGLETTEVSRAIAQLTRESQRRTKLPSRTEAEKMLKAEAISESDYEDVLEAQGYAQKWIDAFKKTIKVV